MDTYNHLLANPFSLCPLAVLPPPRRRWLARRSVVFLLALLLLSACSQQSNTPPHQTTVSSRAPPHPTTTTTAAPGPSPVASLLGPVPNDCPSAPPPQRVDVPNDWVGFGSHAQLLGNAPVWIVSPYYPTTLHLNQQGYTPWPTTKIIWEIGPNFSQSVQVRVSNLRTGEMAWWGPGGPPQAATQTLILGLNHPNTGDPNSYHGLRSGGWQEWGTALYLTAAGCYALGATWTGGHWRVIFSAGQ